ncbi:BON domain-containing protein [Bradymonas sediminis]|uniref:Uncharacterized protein n=1 Tax=Bradymonas sediminis TaxID=1548548 RepID=A0A2Z4FPU3_9DELT|nr:BON domain-containing protein [Bradymonas sediminis]AWV90688.1 hypothetical protein DN745_15745 [Bradymonas sediminis]TDP62672.1 BON domain-containing protein [Bradymonas sediminis]
MRVKQARRQSRPTIVVVLTIVALLAAAWIFFGNSADKTMRAAGSTAVVAPIAPLRLVSAMGGDRSPEDTPPNTAEAIAITDAELEVAVASKLKEMKLPADTVTIDVKDREANLTGRVADPLLRDAIEITVRSVPGVRTVSNRLEVLNAAVEQAP